MSSFDFQKFLNHRDNRRTKFDIIEEREDSITDEDGDSYDCKVKVFRSSERRAKRYMKTRGRQTRDCDLD